MARGGFSGGRSDGGGGFGTFGKIGGGTNGKSGKARFMAKLRGEGDETLTADERYKLNFQKKMDDMRAEASKGARFGISLPGTSNSEGRELSDSAIALLEQLAMKKAKKEAKIRKKRRQVKIKAASFGGMVGGRIDGKGKIYGPDGTLLAKVTAGGAVKPVGGFGGAICKYDGSSFSEYKIARYVEKVHTQKMAKAATAGTGGFWGGGGSSSSDDPTGGFWG